MLYGQCRFKCVLMEIFQLSSLSHTRGSIISLFIYHMCWKIIMYNLKKKVVMDGECKSLLMGMSAPIIIIHNCFADECLLFMQDTKRRVEAPIITHKFWWNQFHMLFLPILCRYIVFLKVLSRRSCFVTSKDFGGGQEIRMVRKKVDGTIQ